MLALGEGATMLQGERRKEDLKGGSAGVLTWRGDQVPELGCAAELRWRERLQCRVQMVTGKCECEMLVLHGRWTLNK